MDPENTTDGVMWRPIETAPKDGTPILAVVVFCDDGSDDGVHVIRWDERWRLWVIAGSQVRLDETGDESDDRKPTHWMPVPEFTHV